MKAEDIIPEDAPPDRVLERALELVRLGGAAAIATVIARKGSAPGTPGQKLALGRAGGRWLAVGSVGGGAVERAVVAELLLRLERPAAPPKTETFRLGPTLGMCCGGSLEVLIEGLSSGMTVLIVGAGHVGFATAELLAKLAFRVVLVDAREHVAARSEAATLASPGFIQVIWSDLDDPEIGAQVPDPRGAALIVATHDHQEDQRAIEWGLGRGFQFVGGVGSRAKAARTRERLAHKGLESEAGRVRMPIGLDIGARSPTEIAVSIAAELIGLRRELAEARDKVESPPSESTALEGRTADGSR